MLLHGALDWMFAVDTARMAHEQLLAAGADVTYREVPDLSHTYPRDENDAVLRWFDASLALPDLPASADTSDSPDSPSVGSPAGSETP